MPLEFERVLLAYQNYLRAWGVTATQAAWSGIDLERVKATYPSVAKRVAAIYAVATAETLTAADEYMTLKAAAAGKEYAGSWKLSERVDEPKLLPSGMPFQQWMAGGQWRMLADMSKGMDPEVSSAASMARTINEVGTSVYQRPRETTFNRFQVDALLKYDNKIPDELMPYFDEVTTYPDLWDGQSKRDYKGTFERWRRVPSPGACDFCLMLATRSNYTSMDAAIYAGGGEGQVKRTVRKNNRMGLVGVQRRRSSSMESGERYHRACRCTVAMSAATERWEQSAVLSQEDYDRLTTRDADGNLPTYFGGRYSLQGVSVDVGQGVALPERAPWADAWKNAPRRSR